MELGPVSLSPSTVSERGRFLRVAAHASSQPEIRVIPRPPAAAAAAGGRGITGSRHVHSLGVRGGVAAGGALVEVARPESVLSTAVLPSDLGAPVELRAGSAVPGVFPTRRGRGAHLPLAGDREMAVPVVDDCEGSGDVVQASFVERGGGWRCSGAEGRRLPGRSGAPPSPRSGGVAAGFAGVTFSATRMKLGFRRPVTESKCRKKPPRKIHKAEREKHKRDLLNDLFGELGDMLEADRQNNGKACILTDTTRILRDLLSQLESLRKENTTLQNESHYVTMERNELQDENGVLRNEILELQNELATRLAGNPGWGHGTAGSPLPVPLSASTGFPSQQPIQSPTIANPVFPLQQPVQQPTVIAHSYIPAPPRELKLFPDAASAVEGIEPSEDQEAPNHVARPQARYPTQSASWPVSLGLPRMEDEQCSSGTTGSSKEGSSGRD